MLSIKRRRIFVDARVQGTLIARMFGYWMFCLLSIALMLLCYSLIFGPARIFYTHFDQLWFDYGGVAVAYLVLMPLVLYDSLRVSHRFVGPMVRLRRAMHLLAEGEKIPRLHFRQGDFWCDLANELNAIAERMNAVVEPSKTFVSVLPADITQAAPDAELLEQPTAV